MHRPRVESKPSHTAAAASRSSSGGSGAVGVAAQTRKKTTIPASELKELKKRAPPSDTIAVDTPVVWLRSTKKYVVELTIREPSEDKAKAAAEKGAGKIWVTYPNGEGKLVLLKQLRVR